MKYPYQSYVFMGLLGTILVVSFSGCEKSGGNVDSQPTVADARQSSASSSQGVIDLQLSNEVDQAIAAEESMSEFDIGVLATNGIVRLTGEVDTRAEYDQLVMIVRAVTGVDLIDNQVQVKQ